jgi:hypothetical protein
MELYEVLEGLEEQADPASMPDDTRGLLVGRWTLGRRNMGPPKKAAQDKDHHAHYW